MNLIKTRLGCRCNLFLKRRTRGQPRWLSQPVEQATWFRVETSSTPNKEIWSLIRTARKQFKIIKRTWRWTLEAISKWWGWWIRHRTPTYLHRRRIWPRTTPSSRREVAFQPPNRAREERLLAKINRRSSQTHRTIKGEGAAESWCWVRSKCSSTKWWLNSSSSYPWRWATLALKAQQPQPTMQPTQATHSEGRSNRPSTSKSTNNSCRCTQAATEFWIKANSRRSTIRTTRRSTTIAGNSSSCCKSSKFSRFSSSSTTTTTMSVASRIPTAAEVLLAKITIRICLCRHNWRRHRQEAPHRVTIVRLLRPSACSTRPAYQTTWTLATCSSLTLERTKQVKADPTSRISTTWATSPWRTKTCWFSHRFPRS